jgi:hypothetical protein
MDPLVDTENWQSEHFLGTLAVDQQHRLTYATTKIHHDLRSTSLVSRRVVPSVARCSSHAPLRYSPPRSERKTLMVVAAPWHSARTQPRLGLALGRQCVAISREKVGASGGKTGCVVRESDEVAHGGCHPHMSVWISPLALNRFACLLTRSPKGTGFRVAHA